MTLMVCVDDQFGMAFNRRRQSRDRAVCEDMLRFANGRLIRMSLNSAKLFAGMQGHILAEAGYLKNARPGECCFVETDPVTGLDQKASAIVLYHWNRRYGKDLYFDISLAGWELIETTEFPGSSHETITREVYHRGK